MRIVLIIVLILTLNPAVFVTSLWKGNTSKKLHRKVVDLQQSRRGVARAVNSWCKWHASRAFPLLRQETWGVGLRRDHRGCVSGTSHIHEFWLCYSLHYCVAVGRASPNKLYRYNKTAQQTTTLFTGPSCPHWSTRHDYSHKNEHVGPTAAIIIIMENLTCNVIVFWTWIFDLTLLSKRKL